MNRRIVVPTVVLLGLIAVGATLEYTGQTSSRSATGRAAGLSAYTGGCAGPVELPDELPTDIQVGMAAAKSAGAAGPDDEPATVPNRFVLKLLETDSIVDAIANMGPGSPLSTGNDGLDELLDNMLDGELKSLVPQRKPGTDRHHVGWETTVVMESSLEVSDLYSRLMEFDEVLWIEPVYVVNAAGMPNDPYYGYQWHLSTMAAHINWDHSDGSGIVVAVVDTGVSAGNDGFDNLMTGYDFVDNDSDASDANGHGTHVAGTIAQATNNGLGVASMAPGASILPVRVLDQDGAGTSDGVAAGIIYSVDNGAQIINLSLGGDAYSQVIADACDYAEAAGVLVVAATGNEGYSDFISYPAALDSTVAVGAVDLNSEATAYSNKGDEIDMVAPGGDLSQDADGDGYPDGVLQETSVNGDAPNFWFFEGTSMATPHVAGAAAVLMGAGVTDLVQLRTLLVEHADDLGPAGWDSENGFGGLNLTRSFEALDAIPASAPPAEEESDEDATEEEVEEPEEEVAEEDETETPTGESPRPNEPEPQREPKIWGVKVEYLNPYMASLRWRTTAPGTTEYSGSDGSSEFDKNIQWRHSAIVRSTAETVVYTLVSRFPDQPGGPDQTKVVVEFGRRASGR
jgi:subtilisin family serine protease